MENSKKKILVVEDDLALQEILIDRLSLGNFHIFKASDGEEAVSQIMENKPHLILLDLLLPKLDGFQVLERIRNFPESEISEVKVIVLSNLWSNKDILRAQSLKVDEYFVKANTNLDEVFDKMKKILG